MKTKAAILFEQRQPLVIDEVEMPALTYGQVLVKVLVSRICGSQIGEIDGVKGPDRWLPHLLGHEGTGIVEEVGPEVTHVKPGDKVVMHWRPGAGIEARPPKYKLGSQTVNAGFITTFNDYAIVSENRLTPIPHDFDSEVGALLADTLTTGFGVVNNDAGVRIGESLVLFGAGGIGLGTLLGAKLAGANPIIAIDLHAHKLEAAQQFGATHAFLGTDPQLLEKIEAALGAKHADVVVDGTGNPQIIEQCYRLTHPKGRCVLFGVMPHDRNVNVHTLDLHFGKVLTGSEGGASLPHLDIPRYVRMINAGKFNPKPMVSHRLPLEDVNDGIQKMRSGEVLHAMIQFA